MKYGGDSFETGIIFNKHIGSANFISVSARAKCGEITCVTKKIQNNDVAELSLFARTTRKFTPSNPGIAFKLAVLKHLENNHGKLNNTLMFEDKQNSRYPVVRIMSLAFMLMLFAIIPPILVRPFWETNSFAISIIESFAAPSIVLTIIIVIFLLMGKNTNLAKYHGAEHMAIKCLRENKPLTLNNIKKYSPEDVRCGSCFLVSLLLASAIISVCIFSFTSVDSVIVRTLIRLASIPVSYIVIFVIMKITLRSDSTIAKIILNIICSIGIWLQRLVSIRYPDDAQLEVAIVGAKALLAIEKETNQRSR